MAQVVEFAGQLNVTLQNISEDENTHGLAEAYNRLAQVMDELCIPMREEEEPISHEEACETAERLYRQLIEQAKDHTTIRLAQAMNRAWAELTVVEGLDRLARPQKQGRVMGNGTPSDEYESVEMWFMRRTTDRLVRENFEMTDRLVKEDYTLRTIINTSVRKLNDIHQQISGLKEVI